MSTLELTGVRPSSAALCPRRAVYDHQAAEQDPPSAELDNWRRRGHAIEAYRVAEMRADGAQIETQREVPWPPQDPLGVGHIDVYDQAEKAIVEITSTAGAKLPDHKAVQAALYLHADADAEQAIVLSIDPSSFDERAYPISLDGLLDDVLHIEETVAHAIRTSTLPERTCHSPWDSTAFFCPYVWTVCFQDWEPAGSDVLFGMLDEAKQLADVTDDLADARRRVKALEERQGELRGSLAPAVPAKRSVKRQVVEDAGPVMAEGVQLARSVSTSRRFSLADYEKAGHVAPAEMEPFITETESDRWTVKRVAG